MKDNDGVGDWEKYQSSRKKILVHAEHLFMKQAQPAGQPDWLWRRRKITNFRFSDKMVTGAKIVQPVTRRPLGCKRINMNNDENISWLIGQKCNLVNLNHYTWSFNIKPEGIITTESFWRIIINKRIKLCSNDDNQKFGLEKPINASEKATKLLHRKKIINAYIDPETYDLKILFEGNIRVEFIVDSSGYESWHIYKSDKTEYHAQGGGNIVTYSK